MKKSVHMSKAMSDGKNSNNNYGCLILFGLVFGGFGSIFVFIMLILPLWRVSHASNWIDVPCTIIESRVGESSDSDGTTYRVEVRFSYAYNSNQSEIDPSAQRYESTTYDFTAGMYSSGRSEKKNIVNQLQPGSQHTCAVNPNNPSEAVLVRDLPDSIWFGLIPLIFPAIGFGLVYMGFRMRRTARLQQAGLVPITAQATTKDAMPKFELASVGPVELNLVQSRFAKVIGIGIFALIWNGITWTILVFAILPDLNKGDFFAWFPLIFISIFVLIGLIVVGVFIHQLLALTNPKLRLTVNKNTLSPGDTLELSWECSGNTSKVTAFTLTLEGNESATYRRGTNTHTEKHIFARLPIATLDSPASLLTGRTTLSLPHKTMPTFKGSNNTIEWVLKVKGSIPRWPDVNDEYEIIIIPNRSTP